MGLPIIGWLPKVIKAAASILGVDSVKDVVDAIENNKLTPEQRVKIAEMAASHEEELRRLDIDEMKSAMSEYIAMISSSDKYVSRARPTGLYIFYTVSAALAVAMMFGVKLDPTAILTLLSPLAGVGGLYVYKRTSEKMNGNGNGD